MNRLLLLGSFAVAGAASAGESPRHADYAPSTDGATWTLADSFTYVRAGTRENREVGR